MDEKKGLLIVISGPSGTGKGTICKSLVGKGDFLISVSATTRQPRQGEVDGVNYYFLTKEEFKTKIENDDFIEYAEVYGNYYGTPKSKVLDCIKNGINVILEIDIQGALKVKKTCPDGVFIFVIPPSMDELRKRISNRGTETPQSLMLRFRSAYEEIKYISRYNYVVVNDTVDMAVKRIQSIIIAEQCRADRRKGKILDLEEEIIDE
ncbi:guanylate kinase [Clostridium fermenticellae]|uniref:Guanylate kinase n=1 Tax=Clostridium fermenticellae TaxID=2068654 RepID=A0A386H2T5_9CLOT|nr:guanylate kinase [Clostridium fermenticellae]AYD40009.1 guanylate kinase [Clostridium fermenticellae]